MNKGILWVMGALLFLTFGGLLLYQMVSTQPEVTTPSVKNVSKEKTNKEIENKEEGQTNENKEKKEEEKEESPEKNPEETKEPDKEEPKNHPKEPSTPPISHPSNPNVNEADQWYRKMEDTTQTLFRLVNESDRMWADYLAGVYPSKDLFLTNYNQNFSEATRILLKINHTVAIGSAQDFKQGFVQTLNTLLSGIQKRGQSATGGGGVHQGTLNEATQQIEKAYADLQKLYRSYGVRY